MIEIKNVTTLQDNELLPVLQEMQEHICDHLCKFPGNPDMTQEGLDEVCDVCKIGDFLSRILNQDESADRVEQEPLPDLKNNDQRKEWLRNYRAWGLWYEDRHIGARYYKYDFDNGARLIAEEYEVEGYNGETYNSYTLHLVGGPEPPKHPSQGFRRWNRNEKYNRHPSNETELVEFLKEVQRR